MTKDATGLAELNSVAFAFQTYPADITQHVIVAMTPNIEAEIRRVHQAVEAAKADALKQALKKFNTAKTAND
ncbi:MAG: hypothetical protein EON58_23260, partial [Alphaproteobacteria bacterium]